MLPQCLPAASFVPPIHRIPLSFAAPHCRQSQPRLRQFRRSENSRLDQTNKPCTLFLWAQHNSFASKKHRSRRLLSLLGFFFKGSLLLSLCRLFNPSPVAASIQSTVIAGSVLSETSDVNRILRDAMNSFGMDPANPEWVALSKEYLANIVPVLPKILFQLSICLIAFRISTVAGASLRTYYADRNIDVTTVSFLVGLVRYSVLLVATMIVFRSLGVVPPQSVTALITSVSLAVGLAFQSVLGNVAAGLMLLVFRPYSVGDKVNIGHRVGFVYDISLLTTRLDAEDNTRIQVPNSEVFKGVVENYTLNPLRRVEVPILVAHSGSVARTREVLEGVVAEFAYLSIAGSTQAPKAERKKPALWQSSVANYMDSLSNRTATNSSSNRKSKKPSSSSSSSSSKSSSSSESESESSSTTLYLASLKHKANSTQHKKTSPAATDNDSDDGINDHDQVRILHGLGWLGGLTQKSVKPVIKTMSRGYDQFMRVAEIQYQNPDVAVMTKVPGPEVVMKEISPLGQKWIARAWVPSRRYNRVHCRMTEAAAKALQEEGVPVVGMGPAALAEGQSQSIGSAYLAGALGAGYKSET